MMDVGGTITLPYPDTQLCAHARAEHHFSPIGNTIQLRIQSERTHIDNVLIILSFHLISVESPLHFQENRGPTGGGLFLV